MPHVDFNSLLDKILCKEAVMAFEVAMIITGIIMALSQFQSRPIISPQYLPNAVTGFATLTGALAAFTGFWLTQIYTNTPEQTKKWLTKRIAIIVPIIGFSLFLVGGGINQLVYGSLEKAVNFSSSGLSVIVVVDLEVSFMTFYRGFSKKELGS
jgi:hypothetical protein